MVFLLFDGHLTAIFDATKLPQFLVLPIYSFQQILNQIINIICGRCSNRQINLNLQYVNFQKIEIFFVIWSWQWRLQFQLQMNEKYNRNNSQDMGEPFNHRFPLSYCLNILLLFLMSGFKYG